MNAANIDLTQHPLLEKKSEIKHICDPILKSMGISYFCFLKIYKDASRIILTNKPHWIEHFYHQGYYATQIIAGAEFYTDVGFSYWSDLMDNVIFSDGRENFNIYDGVTYIRKDAINGVTNIYLFGTTREDMPQYIHFKSDIELLYKFIWYFHEKAKNLIAESTHHKIYIPNREYIEDAELIKQHRFNLEQKALFSNDMQTKKIFIDEKISLSLREAQCVHFLMQGKTAKQIGRALNISYRTVQIYIDKIKLKLQCTHKDDIIKKIHQYGLLDSFTRGFF